MAVLNVVSLQSHLVLNKWVYSQIISLVNGYISKKKFYIHDRIKENLYICTCYKTQGLIYSWKSKSYAYLYYSFRENPWNLWEKKYNFAYVELTLFTIHFSLFT